MVQGLTARQPSGSLEVKRKEVHGMRNEDGVTWT